MLSRKFKKIIGISMLVVCLFTMNGYALAATNWFSITVNSTQSNQDNLSKRTVKNTDGDKYFYVTPYSFNSSNASIWAKSVQLSGSAASQNVYVENGIGETRDGYYNNGYAPGNVYYYMYTSYGYSSSGTVTATGYYTP